MMYASREHIQPNVNFAVIALATDLLFNFVLWLPQIFQTATESKSIFDQQYSINLWS